MKSKKEKKANFEDVGVGVSAEKRLIFTYALTTNENHITVHSQWNAICIREKN